MPCSKSQGAFVSTLLATRIYRINKDLTIYYTNCCVGFSPPLGPLFSVGIFRSLARMPTFRLNLKSLFFYDSLEYPDFLPIKTKKAAAAIHVPKAEGLLSYIPKIFILLSKLLSVIFCTTLHSLINVFAVVSFA